MNKSRQIQEGSWNLEEGMGHRLFPIFMAFSLKTVQGQLEQTLSSKHHEVWPKLLEKMQSFSNLNNQRIKLRDTLAAGKWKGNLLSKERSEDRALNSILKLFQTSGDCWPMHSWSRLKAAQLGIIELSEICVAAPEKRVCSLNPNKLITS